MGIKILKGIGGRIAGTIIYALITLIYLVGGKRAVNASYDFVNRKLGD